MPPRDIFLSIMAIAGVPVAGLAVLAALAMIVPGAALALSALTLLAALAIAGLWSRDIGMLSESLRRTDGEEPAPHFGLSPTLAPMARLMADIERLARHMAARAALVERLRRANEAIVERLPDPLIVLGADRAILRANAAARAAFGADMPSVLRHPDLRGAIDRAFDDIDGKDGGGQSGTPRIASLVLHVPVARDVHAAVIPMDPPLSDGGRAVVVLSDRTRERAVERMRADFVANVSHELRTPLTSLIGFVDTLLGPAADDPPAQRRFLHIMAEQGARMHRLIDDLLSLSRIEMIEHQPPLEQVDLAELVARLAAGFEPRLRDRKATLDIDIRPGLAPVQGDTDQLAQVVQNLLDNALKYGREGAIITVRAGPAPAGTRFPSTPGMVLTVADQGQGIAREHLPRLTERFYRVDKGRSRAVGGTGLGLAIVKHIVNRHRGQMLIESEVGVGTTIDIWLPRPARNP